MNLSELIDEVYIKTGRPDLVDRTLSAVKASTLKLHQVDFFSKDIYESGIQFSTADYLQQLEIRTLFPRYRKLKYLRKYDEVSQAPGDFISIILPDSVLDGWGVTRDDVAYEAGTVFNIRSSTLTQFYLVGFYQHPDVTTDNYSSWIADNYPFAIIYDAAATLLRLIDKDSTAASVEKEAAIQLMMMRNSELALVGE